MTEYVLSVKKPRGEDPSAAIFTDGELAFAVEEERFTRQKHATNSSFPEKSIKKCLDHCGIQLEDLDKLVYPHTPRLENKMAREQFQMALVGNGSFPSKLSSIKGVIETQLGYRFLPTTEIWTNRYMGQFGDVDEVEIETYSHHACHAASVLLCEEFDQGMILTIDGKGEYDSTVVWNTNGESLDRIQTYTAPNSLGTFYAIITEYLGYRSKNGEGKVMGLAPYGSENNEIESTFRDLITTGHRYDVTELTRGGVLWGVEQLEEEFGRERETNPQEFTQWQKDFAYVAQSLLEEIVTDIIEHYSQRLGESKVGLAGGVALNCKMNKRIMETDAVDELVIQPVAHDSGLALGGGVLGSSSPRKNMTTVYHGPAYTTEEITELLETNKISYEIKDDIESVVANEIADGKLVGWFQGRLEMGPRALGNRSILADPRTEDSRHRINKFVKHREGWRPFAPSMLEDAVEDYLVDGQPAPYMIRTFDVDPERQDELAAVLHPADATTRPQTVRKEQNPRYHKLLTEFENLTGVPVLLNTSFNDHAEPIVNKPIEAIKDFYGMGLDILVLEDVILRKSNLENS